MHDVEFSTEGDDGALEDATRVGLALGRAMTAVEIHAANRLRAWAIDDFQGRLFRNLSLDALVTPTTPMVAPALSEAAAARGESNTALTVRLIKFVFLANLLGLPSLSVPLPTPTDSSLPVGLMFTGPWWGESDLLGLAATLPAFDLPRPAHFAAELDAVLGGS